MEQRLRETGFGAIDVDAWSRRLLCSTEIDAP